MGGKQKDLEWRLDGVRRSLKEGAHGRGRKDVVVCAIWRRRDKFVVRAEEVWKTRGLRKAYETI